jgi:hypothetical protein
VNDVNDAQNQDHLEPLSAEELAAEGAAPLPDKEVASILDLNADLNIGLGLAAPVDLGVAANANVAAPIEASAGANVLSAGSTAVAGADQSAAIHQGVAADAVANAQQASTMTQGADAGTATPAPAPAPAPAPTATPGSITDGNLLNVDVNAAANADIAAPINGAVAANANVAAPIDASVAANIGSIDSQAAAVSHQGAVIDQNITGSADATSGQQSDIQQ